RCHLHVSTSSLVDTSFTPRHSTEQVRGISRLQMEGLNAAGKWTTIRMNIHMHVQAQSAGASLTTDEPWVD
ncbi:hypothetical protein, partial [Novosphingobium mathurense]|uniref:hypothetical protein n=1 Tax=Novosphingobium mathurense TaxID=428990 RepID=UPI001C378560